MEIFQKTQNMTKTKTSPKQKTEAKIADLENKIRYAQIIDESEIDTKTVQVGKRSKKY